MNIVKTPRTIFATTAMLATMMSLTPAQAATHYDEAVDGDLGMGSITVLGFDAGINTIKGQMGSYSFSDGSQVQYFFDLDPAEVLLAPGLHVTSANVAVTFTSLGANTKSFDWTWQFIDLPYGIDVKENCFGLLGSSPCALSPAGGALKAGAWMNSPGFIVAQGGGHDWYDPLLPAGGAIEYTLSFNVAAVPEPASVLLMLGGLAFVALRRRLAPGSVGSR